jgi:hypothetical protein
MREKLSRIYFMVQDTKGNAKASIRYLYQMALTRKRHGKTSLSITQEMKKYKEFLKKDEFEFDQF